jgi:hypothetical protein
MAAPAAAGPTMRAELNVALLRLTGVRQVVGVDHLRHERLPHGRVDDGGEAEGEGQRVDVPQLHGAAQVEHREHEGEHAHRAWRPMSSRRLS